MLGNFASVNKLLNINIMWSVICFILALIIVVMVAVVVLYVAWAIIRFVLNMICAVLFGESEMF